MVLAAYSIITSLLYAVVWTAWPDAADALVIAFVAVLLAPTCWSAMRGRDDEP